MAVCKIMNKNTGEFAKKGLKDDIWSKQGNAWADIQFLKKHLSLLLNDISSKRLHEYITYGVIIEYTDNGPVQTDVWAFYMAKIEEAFKNPISDFDSTKLKTIKKIIEKKVGL